MSDQTTTTTGASGTTTTGATTTAATDWTSGLNDDLKGYVQTKGFKDTTAVLDSYRNLEKLMGAPKERLVRLPEKDDDAEGWSQVFERLGRPKEAKEYGIKAPAELGDAKFIETMQAAFHEAGLSKRQAEQIVGKWNEHMTGTITSNKEMYQAKLAEQEQTLKKEWGMAYEQNVKAGQRAAQMFGIDGATIDKLEETMGFAGVMKLMHQIGSKIGEDSFVSADGKESSFSGSLTPEAARHRIDALKKDPDFAKKIADNNAEARAEWDRLHKFAYPAQ